VVAPFMMGPIFRGTGLNFFFFSFLFFGGGKGLFWTHCKSNITLFVGCNGQKKLPTGVRCGTWPRSHIPNCMLP